MNRLVVVAVSLLVLMACSAASADGEPSAGAKGMAGAIGTFEFKPADWMSGEKSYWLDTDGVDPGLAGCHVGADSEGRPNGRTFGEACIDEQTLVESNPGAMELHSHTNDVGHPDKFDCQAWCVGEGASSGMCVAAPAPPCSASARCACE